MNWANIGTVYVKEVRDMLRDRRSLISMFVIPSLLFPLMGLVGGGVAYKVVNKARAASADIMVLGAEYAPELVASLSAQERINIVATADDFKERISNKSLRAAVEIPVDFKGQMAADALPEIAIYTYDGELKSELAVRLIRNGLRDWRTAQVSADLAARGLPTNLAEPFTYREQNVAPPERVGGNAIGGLIPYMLVLLCFTGAMYPAMDLTAGEKERGTMETILCSPLARLDLVLGKFFTVLTASLATVLCALTSMGVTFMIAGYALADKAQGMAAAANSAGQSSGGGVMPSLDPFGIVAMIGMIVPVAVLFSATLLALSLFAKSFKEAQSYVSPLVIVIILPAVIGMLPGVELNARLALIPILNLSLISKELVSGVFHWDYIAVIFGSSCAYAAVALGAAVYMFNRESVLFRN